MINATPLIQRDLDDTIFFNSKHEVSCATFLGQITELTKALPDNSFAINLCEDRHAFMLGFFAAVLGGQTILLPASRRRGVIRETLREFRDSYVLHDGVFDDSSFPQFNLGEFKVSTVSATEIPVIPDEQLAAIVHTSGSTGESTRLNKYWRTFTRGIQIDASYIRPVTSEFVSIVATVPPWHMYGIETTVLLPLVTNSAVYTGHSLFPEDIRVALERLPAPRFLVSTPVHLRAIVRAELEFPQVDRILCATAPLSSTLARDVENVFRGRMQDLYGCSEVGLIGHRWITDEPEWTFFHELDVKQDGTSVTIGADHLPENVPLSDTIEIFADGRFRILGRSEELVKIGGKRGSLAEFTQRLLTIEGVKDGVIFRRSEGPDTAEVRLSALVVSSVKSADEIRSELAEVIDPVFLPRPIRIVDKLPRSSTGKLRKADLEKIATTHS